MPEKSAKRLRSRSLSIAGSVPRPRTLEEPAAAMSLTKADPVRRWQTRVHEEPGSLRELLWVPVVLRLTWRSAAGAPCFGGERAPASLPAKDARRASLLQRVVRLLLEARGRAAPPPRQGWPAHHTVEM